MVNIKHLPAMLENNVESGDSGIDVCDVSQVLDIPVKLIEVLTTKAQRAMEDGNLPRISCQFGH